MRGIATAVAGAGLTVALTGCGRAAGSEPTVVASFYPLAFVVGRLAGPAVKVVDLTPPGAEAHDVELSYADRSAIAEADLILYLGDVGFQPQVEGAVKEASGTVLSLVDAADLRGGSAPDPHVWLEPRGFARIVEQVGDALARMAAPRAGEVRARARELISTLKAIAGRYERTLNGCRYRTMIVTHEAFGYLAEAYGLEQVGLAGLAPEGEPTSGRLGRAEAAIGSGRAGALFYEETEEARRIARPVSDDLGVPAIPLATLESRPVDGDYLTALDANLRALARGLECP